MVDKVLHTAMPFTTSGQTINDRLNAAKHSIAGSQLGKTVCKATTEECLGPKKKHLDYLLHCTHEPNVSIPQLANLLIERTQGTQTWAVVFKALITIHNLMCYGNERFSQYLASSNANFDLGNYLDKTSVQGYDMSTHVRRYAKYIREKVYTYRLCAFDFCKVKRGKEDGLLRTMPADKLLKVVPILQGQVDALLEFQVTSSELTNGVINSCFILLFRDLIRLFACYNDGIINLLEKYFDMNKKQCREALDLYKKFLMRMDKVSEFLKVAESVGIDRGEIPDLAKAPGSLLEALEAHLAALEGQKPGSRVASPTSTTTNLAQSAISALSNNTSPSDSHLFDTSAYALDDATKRRYLDEEQQRLNALKEQRLRELQSGGAQKTNSSNPFVSGVSGRTEMSSGAKPQTAAIDDLLSLDTNPFGSAAATDQGAFGNGWTAVPAYGASTAPYGSGAPNFMNGSGSEGRGPTSMFASDATFAQAFGNNETFAMRTQRQEASPATNPFLSGFDSEPSAASWATGVGGSNPFAGDSFTSTTGGGLDVSSPDDASLPEGVAGQNPFATFQHNALGGDDVSVNVLTATPRDINTYQELENSTPFETRGDVPTHGSLYPRPPSAQELDMSTPVALQLSGSPSGSPAISPTKSMTATAMQIPTPSNIYQHTPFSNFDASYTSSPQFPRHMFQPSSSPTPMSSSFVAGAGASGARRTESPSASGAQRPPSAPAAELSGLDPLGDLLTPQAQQTRPSQSAGAAQQGQQKAKIFSGDLDSSLANLADNLAIGRGQSAMKQTVQWGAPRPAQPMGVGMQSSWNAHPMANYGPGYPQGGWGMQQQQQQPMMPPMQAYGQARPGMMGTMPYGQPTMIASPQRQPQSMAQAPQQFDPFGL